VNRYFCLNMITRTLIQAKKIMIMLLLMGACHIALGSFTGNTDKNSKNIYSLKSFNKTFYKSASLFSLRAGFEYKNTKIFEQKKNTDGSLTFNSMVRYEKGTTTYIYPYKHTVTVPKFKTPTPPVR
jgi:hypothetical protein